MALTFEWDEEKAESNLNKHRVSFEEARTVFGDPLALTMPDSHHSSDEERFITVGMSYRHTLLVVVYTERGSSFRLISCRRATRAERQAYEED